MTLGHSLSLLKPKSKTCRLKFRLPRLTTGNSRWSPESSNKRFKTTSTKNLATIQLSRRFSRNMIFDFLFRPWLITFLSTFCNFKIWLDRITVMTLLGQFHQKPPLFQGQNDHFLVFETMFWLWEVQFMYFWEADMDFSEELKESF